MTLITSFTSTTYFSAATPDSENRSLIVTQGLEDTVLTNGTNIILVHGIWSDGSIWNKVIPILQDAGHRVTAAQLSLRSLEDDIATVKRAIEENGGPTILVGHSYGGIVITNAGYNNPNVTGLVYIEPLLPTRENLLLIFLKYSLSLRMFYRCSQTTF